MQTIEEKRQKNKERMRKLRGDPKYREKHNKKRRTKEYHEKRKQWKSNKHRKEIIIFFNNELFSYELKLWFNRNIPFLNKIGNYYECNKKRYQQYYQKPDVRKKRKEYYQKYGNEYMKNYYKNPIVKKKRKEYMKNYYKKNKDKLNNYSYNFYQNNKQWHKDYAREYYERNKDEIRLQQKDYLRTENGKAVICKLQKYRRDRLKHILLMPNIFPEEIEIDYHHLLNDFHSENNKASWFLIPMPKNIHRLVNGNLQNKKHWSYNAEWIKKLYCLDIKELLKP